MLGVDTDLVLTWCLEWVLCENIYSIESEGGSVCVSLHASDKECKCLYMELYHFIKCWHHVVHFVSSFLWSL